MNKNIFPKWTNKLPFIVLIGLSSLISCIVFAFWYWGSPSHLEVGYQPEQPIPYSHRLHAGELGIDCRYCHTNVFESSHANIPSTETCMNCHNKIKTDSPHIQKLQESYDTNTPIEWVNVHQLPDYVYFDHSRHVNSGVGCVSCHGKVNKMEVVYQAEPMSMKWCLDCHRSPEKHLRPKDKITQLDWEPEDQEKLGLLLKEEYHINPGVSCSVCHN